MKTAGPLVAVLAVLMLGGCAGGDPASTTAPGLDARLHRVDAAIVAEHWSVARTQLDLLRGEATQARRSGTISVDQANRIQEAVATLSSRLPGSSSSPRARDRHTGGS